MWTTPSASCSARDPDPQLADLVELGLQHEQQHQELLLTDIKHAFWCNPLQPAYRGGCCARPAPGAGSPLQIPAGSRRASWKSAIAGEGFAFDNETPRHRTLLQPHAIANRLVTNAEYLAFVREGGYREPGLVAVRRLGDGAGEGWQHPLYWQEDLASEFTLAGLRPLDPEEPVCHLSYFEADAFARWAGARLPTEAEWESGGDVAHRGNLQDSGRFHPQAAAGGRGPAADVRRRVGMDRLAVRQLPRLSPVARFAGRVQRQIHEWPVGASWRLLRDAA